MARLPIINGDKDAWGSILIGYLQVSHNDDGTLKQTAVGLSPAIRAAFAAPREYVQVYRVNPVGGIGIYSTIGAAITQAKTDIQTQVGNNSQADCSPLTRRAILIDPGTYDETINNGAATGGTACPPFVDFIGTSGDRDDVVIKASGDYAVMNVPGTCHMENLTLYLTGAATSSGVHALNGGGFSFPLTFSAYNVRFKSDNTATNGPNAVNVVAGNGIRYYFDACDFAQPSGDCQACEFVTQSGTRTRSGAIVCVNCTGSAPECTLSIINFHDNGGSQPDLFAWINPATNGGITQGDSTYGIHLLNSSNHTAFLIVDPSVTDVYSDTAAQVIRSATLPDQPHFDGQDVQSYYLPSQVGKPKIVTPTAPDASGQTVTAKRLYYVPVAIDAQVAVGSVSVGVTSAAGNIAGGVYADDGTGKPGASIQRCNTVAAAAAGVTTVTALTYSKRRLFPGQRQVWVAIVCDSGTADIVCSSLLSTMRPVYYEDVTSLTSLPVTATPTRLAVGTACPIPSLICS